MEAKFQENCFRVQYFEFYINDIVLKTFENSSSDNKLSGSAENLQKNIRMMLNTTRRINGNVVMLLLKYIQQRW